MRLILFLYIFVYIKANWTQRVITTEFKKLCWAKHIDDYPNFFDIRITRNVFEFLDLYLSRGDNNSIISIFQGGDRNLDTYSSNNITKKTLILFDRLQLLNLVRLNELNLTLNIRANFEIDLNSIGATIIFCMLPLNNIMTNMCIEFMNTNLTITVSNQNVLLNLIRWNSTSLTTYQNYLLYRLSWRLPTGNFYQYHFSAVTTELRQLCWTKHKHDYPNLFNTIDDYE
ncbi:uncharacterized protein LOC135924497 [Gordionus sp. m RMFG-2023]|uniref:uncharacterized protein LOC135924497 n=1 Tax=Gordionus sp. m RMFG-2023 TaxID=3053472 RepID=UPI0031FD0863